MNRDKLSGTLTLCKRAGKLILGFDLVKESVQKGTAQLVLFSQDVSPKTAKDIRFHAERHGVPCREIPLLMDEMWYLVGKRAGIAAISDKGFADRLIQA